jgi:serine/threonine-protein kinase
VEPGTIIGERFQIVDRVAEGGLATVWQGVDRETEEPVAIKVMKREFSVIGHHLDLFLEEARIGAQLEHPNLVHVLAFVVEPGAQGKMYCQIMEWIDGIDLRTMIGIESDVQEPLAWDLVTAIGIGVLHGLAAAHERKVGGTILSPVIHRDVAPQNVLLGSDGSIKLGDFGMSRARDSIAEHTAPGIVKGTLAYVAPETLKGQPPSPRSDVYSLGVTLWEALAGDRMFHTANQVELIGKIRAGAIEPLAERRTDVPPRLAAAVHRALSTDVEKRFASARAMASELEEIMIESAGGDAVALVGEAVKRALDARPRDE